MCNIKDLPELSVDNSSRETQLKPPQNWTLRPNRLQALRLTNVSDSTKRPVLPGHEATILATNSVLPRWFGEPDDAEALARWRAK